MRPVDYAENALAELALWLVQLNSAQQLCRAQYARRGAPAE